MDEAFNAVAVGVTTDEIDRIGILSEIIININVGILAKLIYISI